MAMAMVSSAGDASVIQKYRDAAIADIGVFADLPTQNVEDWIDRVNNFQNQLLIKSLEMGLLVITALTQGEVSLQIKRWLLDDSQDFVHANHWSPQQFQAAREHTPYRAAVEEVEAVPAVAAVGVEGQPGYTPARAAIAAIPYVESRHICQP